MYWALHTILAHFGKTNGKTADFRHTIRFIIVSEHCPQKTARTHGQKQLKKGEKMFYTHDTQGPKIHRIFCRFPQLAQF